MTREIANYPAYRVLTPKVDVDGRPWFQFGDTVILPCHLKIFKFGDVFSSASAMGESGHEAFKKAVRLGHKTHWLNPEDACITAHRREQETHYEIWPGAIVRYDGRLWKIVPEPNHNLGLIRVIPEQK